MSAPLTKRQQFGDGAQLELPLDRAPPTVLAHGLRAAHPRPLVSLGKRPGPALQVIPHRRLRRGGSPSPVRQRRIEHCCIGARLRQAGDALARGLPNLPLRTGRSAPVERACAYRLDAGRAGAPLSCRPDRAAALPRQRRGLLRARHGGRSGLRRRARAQPRPQIPAGPVPHHVGPQGAVHAGSTGVGDPVRLGATAVRQTGIGRNCDLFEDRHAMGWPAGERASPGPAGLMSSTRTNSNIRRLAAYTLSEVQATARQDRAIPRPVGSAGWHSDKWIARQARAGAQGQGRPAPPVGSSDRMPKPWTLAEAFRAGLGFRRGRPGA